MTSSGQRLAALAVLFITASGCGGVADAIARHELSVQISRYGRVLPDRRISVAVSVERNAPFVRRGDMTTDASGRAHTSFDTRWSAAFVVIPPLGLVPPRPPKPSYCITVGKQQVVVSPDTPGATYKWEHHGWQTDASVSVP